MTVAIAALGTLLKCGNGASPEVFTTIADVMSITGPTIAAEVVEVTSHSSPNAWREFIPTLLDPGEVSFDINFAPTEATQSQSTGVLRDLKNRTLRNMKLVFPDSGSTTWSYAGYFTKFESKEPTDGKVTAAVTIRLTGQPTLAG